MIVIAALALAFLVPAYWIAWRAPAVGMFHDDGVYLVTAKALATGQGYRIISLPDEIPQTKYPILFPLILSGVWRLAPEFPENAFVLKLVPLAFALAWFCLAFQLLEQEASREVAVVCVVLTAALPRSIYLSTALLSETLFAALCTGSLLILRRAEMSDSEEWIVAAVLAGFACLTRTVGVCVVATGVVYFLRRRRMSHAAGFLAIALAIGGPWFWWHLTQHPPETDAYYSAANYASWNVLSSSFPWGQKLVIVGTNALLLLRSPLSITTVHWNVWVDVLAGAAVLYAGWRWLRPLTVLHIFLGIYAAMLLAWAWPPDRFVAVVYPVILCLGWQVWRAVLERFSERAALLRVAGIAMLAAVAAQGLWNLADSASATLRSGVLLGEGDAWSDTSQLLSWIRDKTPADSVVLTNLDPVFYLYTGRKTVRGFQADPYLLFYAAGRGSQPLGTLAAFRERIRKQRVAYIVRAPNQGFAEAPELDRLILELVKSEPDAIRLVAQGRDPRFQIYHVGRPL